MGQQALVAAARFKACHLGGAHIKGVRAAAEGAGAAAALLVGFQQFHRQSLPGQQGCGGEAGDAGAHHHHIETLLHSAMLATRCAGARCRPG